MRIQFFCCDRCGQVVDNERPNTLKAFKHDKPDGDFVLCWPCYYALTNYLNEQCTDGGLPKGLKIMNNFLEDFNNKFVIEE